LVLIGIFVLVASTLPALQGGGVDFYTFADAAQSTSPYDIAGFFNLPWMLLIVAPFATLKGTIGFPLWNCLQITLLIAGLWMIQPNPRMILLALILCAPALGLHLNIGQSDGLLVFAMGLGLLGARTERPHLVGLAFIILGMKPQNVGFAALSLLLLLPGPLRIRALFLPLAVLIFSLVAWPRWPLAWLMSLKTYGLATGLITRWGVVPIWQLPIAVRISGLGMGGASLWLSGNRWSPPKHALSLALLSSLLISPMVNPYSLVLLTIVLQLQVTWAASTVSTSKEGTL
jgi:hypothetical protein